MKKRRRTNTMKKPKKLLHTHNSISCYFDGLDEGCIECIRNKAISDYEAWLPSEGEINEILDKYIFIGKIVIKDGLTIAMDNCMREGLAQAIHKRIRGE